MKTTPCFLPADILLPNCDLERWSVIACDQYTSEPEYWNRVKTTIADSPSTYNLILPEIFLEDDDVSDRINNIHKDMEKYLADDIFDEMVSPASDYFMVLTVLFIIIR